MKALKRAAVIAAGVIGIGLAGPSAALPAVQVSGPSSISVGSGPLDLVLGTTGEGFDGLAALQVEITSPGNVFGSVLGPLSVSAQYAFPPDWDVSAALSSLGDIWTIIANSIDFPFTVIDLPPDAGALFALSFPVLGASAGPVDLAFTVYFNDATVSTDYRVTINANAVPEPGSLALALAAFAFIALSRRRR